MQGGPKRVRHLVDSATVENKAVLARLESRTEQARYLAARLPEMKPHAIYDRLKERFGRAAPGFSRKRRAARAA